MQSAIINFKIQGPIFEERIPLKELITILTEFHTVLDQSYLTLTGKNRLTKSDRVQYKVIAEFPKQGSYEQVLELIVKEAIQTVLPIIPIIKPNDVWQTTKSAFEFLKLLFQIRQKGIEPEANFDEESGLVIVNQGGENNITVNQNIFNLAEKSEEHFRVLSNQIEEGKIDSISALDKINKGIILSKEEKNLFNPETVIDDTPCNASLGI